MSMNINMYGVFFYRGFIEFNYKLFFVLDFFKVI